MFEMEKELGKEEEMENILISHKKSPEKEGKSEQSS
jgi:hypothetical protein